MKFSKSARSNFRSHFKTSMFSSSYANTNSTNKADTVFNSEIPHGSPQSGKEESAEIP